MPRNTQPRELAELKGAHKRNPQRYRNEVPKNESPLGVAPSHLHGKAHEAWFELEAMSLPGVLTAADRHWLEIASNLLAEYRVNPFDFAAAKLSKLMEALGKLGMNPCDRQKIGVQKQKEPDNEFKTFN